MANPPDGKKKTDIRSRFKKQMDRLKEYAQQAEKALENADVADWMIPDRNEWDGDLFAIEDMKKPFDRSEHHDDMDLLLKDGENPGTSGDLAALQIQGDYLAAMERAFRDRHSTSVRRKIHASVRQKGHSDLMFEKVLTGYVQRLLAKAAGGTGSESTS